MTDGNGGMGGFSGSREPSPAVSALSGFDPGRIAERIRQSDPYLVDYLLGWSGLGPEPAWGAATSFALEVAHGYGLIKGESNTTATALGVAVTDILNGGNNGN